VWRDTARLPALGHYQLSRSRHISAQAAVIIRRTVVRDWRHADRIGGVKFSGNMRPRIAVFTLRSRRGSRRSPLSTIVDYPWTSGWHGDRVETVSRGREPSAIRDPAKWTVRPARPAIARSKAGFALRRTSPAETPFKPLSRRYAAIDPLVRLKKRFLALTLMRVYLRATSRSPAKDGAEKLHVILRDNGRCVAHWPARRFRLHPSRGN
jgi:hypothetical protein